MFLINHDLKAIYIRTPNCANNFICTILNKYYGFKLFEMVTRDDISDFFDNDEHLINSIEYYRAAVFSIRKHGVLRYMLDHEDNNILQNMTEEKWNSYYKFTFVRNPYEKLYACYQKLKTHTRQDDNESNYVSFKSFLDNKDLVGNLSYFSSFIQQYDHLLNYSNQLNMQYIGYLNDVNCDLFHILTHLGVTKMVHLENSEETNFYSNKFHDYKDHYDQECAEKVIQLFSDDFACFGFPRDLEPVIEKPKDTVTNLYLDYKMNLLNNKNITRDLLSLKGFTENFFTNIDIIYNITSENNFMREQKEGILSRIDGLCQRISSNKTIRQAHDLDSYLCIKNDFTFHCEKCSEFTCYNSIARDAHLYFCNKIKD